MTPFKLLDKQILSAPIEFWLTSLSLIEKNSFCLHLQFNSFTPYILTLLSFLKKTDYINNICLVLSLNE